MSSPPNTRSLSFLYGDVNRQVQGLDKNCGTIGTIGTIGIIWIIGIIGDIGDIGIIGVGLVKPAARGSFESRIN